MNKDLADVFGNLVNRLVRFAAQAFAGRVPDDGEPGERERALAAEIDARVARLRAHHEALEFRRAAAETRAIWVRANAYLQEAAPWTAINSDPARAAVATRTALNLIRLSAVAGLEHRADARGRVLAALGEDTPIPPWPTQAGSDSCRTSLRAGRSDHRPAGRQARRGRHLPPFPALRRRGAGDVLVRRLD